MIKKFKYILIFLVFAIIFISPFFIKVHIECKSQEGTCPNELNAKLQMINGKHLFQGDPEVSKLLKKDFIISNFSTQLKLPNILLINVIVKKPIFALKNADSGKFELIDQNGYVLTTSDSSNLPTVSTNESFQKPGEKISDSDLFALKLVYGMYQMYQIGYGTISNDSLLVDMPTGIRVIFPLRSGDTEVLLGGLRLIYTKISNDSLNSYSQIDMRYINPVLR